MQAHHQRADQNRRALAPDFRRMRARQQPRRERYDSKAQIDPGLGRRILDQRQQPEDDAAAQQVARQNAPHDMLAPNQCAPAIGGHLRDGMKGHGRRNRQEQQEHTHQHQPADHPENAA